jgi:hypothetical protein
MIEHADGFHDIGNLSNHLPVFLSIQLADQSGLLQSLDQRMDLSE